MRFGRLIMGGVSRWGWFEATSGLQQSKNKTEIGGKTMAVIEEVIKANESYAKNFTIGDLPMPPGRKLAVVACMDARLTVEEVLGLKTGDAHIIRNAGGIVT